MGVYSGNCSYGDAVWIIIQGRRLNQNWQLGIVANRLCYNIPGKIYICMYAETAQSSRAKQLSLFVYSVLDTLSIILHAKYLHTYIMYVCLYQNKFGRRF